MTAGELYLISEDPEAHGVFDDHARTERMVYCTIRSVGRTEMYAAMSSGHEPNYVFALAHDFEYQGEKICKYEGIEYRIIRTYRTEADGIELTVERSNHHVSASS